MDEDCINFYIKKGALLPALDVLVTDEDGNAVSLTGAQNMIFAFKSLLTNVVYTGQAEIVDADNGHIRYEWNTGDTNTAGMMVGEFRVYFENGYLKFPTEDFINIKVSDSLL